MTKYINKIRNITVMGWLNDTLGYAAFFAILAIVLLAIIFLTKDKWTAVLDNIKMWLGQA